MTRSPAVDRILTAPAAHWIAFVVLSWLALRPVLLVTISLDDFINPFVVLHDYGPSPFGELGEVNREVLRTGHFNFIGATFGAIVFRVYAALTSWGVRYSSIYAATKLAVFVVTACAAGRFLRTLALLTDRSVSVWRSRLLCALVLFGTLQLHVAWSLDPVGSFPLSGYLSVAIGVWALDFACRAIADESARKTVVASLALCVAILYYELNVAMLVAFAPIVLLHLHRSSARRPVIVRAAGIVVPAALMTLVLQAVAAAANRGYTGTDVGVGDETPVVLARTIGGSLPASSWGVARDWLAETNASFSVSFAAAVCLTAVAIVIVFASLRRDGAAPDVPPTEIASPRRDRLGILLVVASPLAIWLSATVVQAATEKVRVETIRLGYVYNYYAYGTVGIAVAALVGLPLLPRRDLLRRARPVLATVAVAFVVAQGIVNDSVHREFGERLVANRVVLAAYSDEAPPAERCAALDAWAALPFWQPYYRTALIDGMNSGYLHYHGEPFCASVTSGG